MVDTLASESNLNDNCRPKRLLQKEDMAELLEHLWSRDTHVYPHEQRSTCAVFDDNGILSESAGRD